jgi:hypothetical protein
MNTSPETIIAVTSDEPRYGAVLDRAAAAANETGATVILYDLDADLGPLESPLPTSWSAEGEEESFGKRLSPQDLEAAGQAALADRVRAVRAAGVKAFGWLPSKADADELARYAKEQNADTVFLSAEDAELIDRLRAEANEDAAGRAQIKVQAVPPG